VAVLFGFFPRAGGLDPQGKFSVLVSRDQYLTTGSATFPRAV